MADWGTPPWRIDVAPAATPPPDTVDIAVVGAGLTGLSAAYHLARAGVRTAVLEAGAIGAGASGRTGALALEGTAAGPLPDVANCLETLARVTRDAGIDCDLRLDGCWEVVHRRTPGTLRPLWPDGDTLLCVAGTEPGGTLDPGKLLAGLARAAMEAGAAIHEHAAVTAIDADHEPALLRVGERIVRAGRVVLALNAYTTSLLPLPAEVSSALTLAICTEPIDAPTLRALGLDAGLPFYTADLPYLWGRTLADRRLIFGSGLIFPDDGDVRTIAIDDATTTDAFARLETRVRAFHPALATIRLTHRWGGPIAFISRRTPILGPHPDAPAVIVTGAYSGHGVALGVRVGELVATAIARGRELPAWGRL